MTSLDPRSLGRRPPAAVAWPVALLVSTVWAVLRLVVFRTIIFPLTYALPLLVCVWTRDKVMLWSMAALFAALHTLKQLWILPHDALPTWADWASYGATLFNVFVGGAVTHAIIVLRDRLEASIEEVHAQAELLARQNEELAQQSEELAEQNEELAQQSEELGQQTEELSQQAEELTGQNEELTAQAEEIQTLNTELGYREGLLQNLLDVLRDAGSQASAVEHVCRTTMEMVGAPACAVGVYEVEAGVVVRRGTAQSHGSTAPEAANAAPFVRLVLEQDRPASVNDASRRPDLVPGADADRLRAVLGAPLRGEPGAGGALLVYAEQPHDWTVQQFQVTEWLADQASHILRTLRLRDLLARHAALLDLTPDAVIVRRLDGTIEFWGGGAEALYGWTKDEAIGRGTDVLLRTRFPRPLPEIIDEVDRTGTWTGELVHTSKDGAQRVVESRWLARRDAHGAIAEILESNVNVTERKRTEEALRDADRGKNEFLATLSHELRNPLAPIRYAVKLLDGSEDGAAQARQVIERQLAHLVRLVDDLLDATRITSNKIRLRKERVEVRPIVGQAVEACLPEIQKAGHELSVDIGPESVWVDGDADRLAQVLMNLLTNASRYTPAGGRIRLACTASPDEVQFRLEDTGIGLNEEDLQRVFDLFAQVGEPGKGGLGIGLSLVKGLVEMHDGQVEAHSSGPGRGSEFLVRLPRKTPPAGARPDEPAAPASAPRSTRRILVVDDNVDSAEMMKTLLELDGHEVHVAYDGHAALARLRAASFEVGLFDIGLPGISGYQLAHEARQIPANKGLYMVAVTGWGQDADRERARVSGFDAHLTKPADPDALRALIARCGEPVS